MKRQYILTILTFFLLVSSNVIAQTEFWPSGRTGWPNDILAIFFGPNIPSAFTQNIYTILQWIIFPFIALWVIIYGILSEVPIFRRKKWINPILAFIFAVVSGPTGALMYSVKIVFTLYGIAAFWLFAGLLFFGTALWGYSKYKFFKPDDYSFASSAKRLKGKQDLLDRIEFYERRSSDRSLKKSERDEALKEYERLTKDFNDEFGK